MLVPCDRAKNIQSISQIVKDPVLTDRLHTAASMLTILALFVMRLNCIFRGSFIPRNPRLILCCISRGAQMKWSRRNYSFGKL